MELVVVRMGMGCGHQFQSLMLMCGFDSNMAVTANGAPRAMHSVLGMFSCIPEKAQKDESLSALS